MRFGFASAPGGGGSRVGQLALGHSMSSRTTSVGSLATSEGEARACCGFLT
jgi:hypothetical protein